MWLSGVIIYLIASTILKFSGYFIDKALMNDESDYSNSIKNSFLKYNLPILEGCGYTMLKGNHMKYPYLLNQSYNMCYIYSAFLGHWITVSFLCVPCMAYN